MCGGKLVGMDVNTEPISTSAKLLAFIAPTSQCLISKETGLVLLEGLAVLVPFVVAIQLSG